MKTKTQNKQEVLGQFFTKKKTVRKLLNILLKYKNYSPEISILEPSFGTGNFIKILKEKGFRQIEGCEIDPELTNEPSDFFKLDLEKEYDLIIGNPPFSKYNLENSFYFPKNYDKPAPSNYLPEEKSIAERVKIENGFIYKSIKHLKDKNSSIAFVLPVSFFIKNKNRLIKKQMRREFSTVFIYQNTEPWFDRNIPCCFAVFTHTEEYKNEIIMIYENSEKNVEHSNLDNITEEMIPEVVFHKNNGNLKSPGETPLKEVFNNEKVKVQKSYENNNVSAKNILEKNKIPSGKDVQNYKIAIVRVGNSSVGKCGLVNQKVDILNDMFYVFSLKEKYQDNKKLKESICRQVNDNLDYFQKITSRVGSKSIKKEDIYKFKINLDL